MLGVGITTTPEREALFYTCLEKWDLFGSDIDFLFINVDTTNAGVARSKNKCIKALYEAGCEHFFLADDDVHPLVEDWWQPYVKSKEPHLMYQFKLPNKSSSDMQELYRDDEIVAYTHTRGAFIYFTREVVDIIGGFDAQYELYGFEHPDFTNRIHNAGLTTHRAMDVVGSDKLLYCYDQDAPPPVSKQRLKSLQRNAAIYIRNKHSSEYKEFR